VLAAMKAMKRAMTIRKVVFKKRHSRSFQNKVWFIFCGGSWFAGTLKASSSGVLKKPASSSGVLKKPAAKNTHGPESDEDLKITHSHTNNLQCFVFLFSVCFRLCPGGVGGNFS
jgi:predicted Rossmann-fold nucleotide-binding protein